MIKKIVQFIIIMIIAGAVLLVWYFNTKKIQTGPKLPVQALPPVQVTLPVVQDVNDFYDFVGNVKSINQVDIKARVEGFLLTADFNDGQHVTQNDLLFTIEPNEFIYSRDQAAAQLLSDQAALQNAELDYKRTQEANQTSAVSKQQLSNAQAARDMAQAKIKITESLINNARRNLSYTRILSPLTGKISRRYVDPGNIVGSGSLTLLATVVQMKPIKVYFNISETFFDQYFLANSNENLQEKRQKVLVGFPDRQDYPFEGFLDFIDNNIDQNTGTILMRAELPNGDEHLFPGMFVNVRLPVGIQKNAILVRENAISSDIGGKYLYTVDPNNTLQASYIVEGKRIGAYRVILSGITNTQKYVLSGFHMIRPGMKINPILQTREAVTNLNDQK